MARPVLSAVIRWAQGAITQPDNFNLGSTTAYDDMSALVLSVSISRGRADPYATIGAARATLTVYDPDGMLSVGYASSVLVAGASDGLGNLQPLRTLKIQFDGTTRFYGFVTRIVANPDAKTATIEASDLLYLLSKPGTADVNTGGQGDTMGVIAALVSGRTTNGSTLINGAVGATPQGVPTGQVFPAGRSTLADISDVLAIEQGYFYVRTDGYMEFLPRYWHDYSPRDVAQSTLTASEVKALNSGVADQGIYNRATAQKTGGTAQTVEVTPWVTDGQADWGTLTSAYFQTDAQALALATWVVGMRQNPQPTAYAADLDADASSAVAAAMLDRDLHDRVNLDAIRVGAADYYILGIDESLTEGRRYTMRWTLLRRRASGVGFVIGYSGFGMAAFG